jgi:predicted DNA-binding protein YlxM (UPF0122 family)
MELAEKLNTIKQLDVYGNMLTTKQKETLEGYLLYDITLTELAVLHSSSRQAIFDTIQKTIKLLSEFEEKIGVIAKHNQILQVVDEIDCTDEKTKYALEKIKDLIN